MDWNSIWTSITSFFTNNFWSIIAWIATLFVGIIVIKILLNIIRRMLNRSKMEKVAQNFLFTFIKFGLYFVLVLLLLRMLGVELSGVLTAVSALILAVGMALQNIIANVANGIIVVTSKIFKKGDFVEVNGVSGSVEGINFLFCTLMTTDNKKITIPNSDILNNPVTNYGANKVRRVDFTFGVAYESDVELVKKIITDVMVSNGKVILEPKAPFCRLKTLNASSIDFFANCWVDTEDYWDVYYYVVENVYNEFKRNDISIPYNQVEIRERKDNVKMPVIKDKLPERVEKERHQVKGHLDLENADLMAIFKRHPRKNKDNKKEIKEDQKIEKTKENK